MRLFNSLIFLLINCTENVYNVIKIDEKQKCFFLYFPNKNVDDKKRNNAFWEWKYKQFYRFF